MTTAQEEGVLSKLRNWDGVWIGFGINHEQQKFNATLVARPLFAGRGTLTWFVAVGEGGQIFHEELSLITNAIDNELTMVSVNSNLPFLQVFTSPNAHTLHQYSPMQLFHGDQAEATGFREIITIQAQPDEGILYSFSWAMPGETMQERSSVVLYKKKDHPPTCCPLR